MAARKRPLFCGAIVAAMAFILVVEGSIPDETNKAKGYWATFGTDKATGQPILTSSWIDRLAPPAWAVVAVGTCAAYGGIHVCPSSSTGGKSSAWSCCR
jgi:hydrogenase small subunit